MTMDPFSYRDGELFAEELPVAQLAERFGTPLYLYSRDALETHLGHPAPSSPTPP